MSNPQIRNHDINSDGTISPLSGQRASFRVVEQKDNNSDIIHLVFRPLYLFPSWTAPRDYCIHRYWRLEDDGSYMVCYDSVVHPDCPPCPPYVRGELNGIYSIAPRRRHGTVNTADIQEECLLTHIVQVDPRKFRTIFHAFFMFYLTESNNLLHIKLLFLKADGFRL